VRKEWLKGRHDKFTSEAENFLRGVQKPVIDLTSDEHTAERTKHTSDGI
jgi:hypothetical protein